jgi:2-phospho-L-lactate guanylyltransferase
MTAPAAGAVAVLVPVKAFRDAKLRLAPALDAESRSRLARDMAENVVRATLDLPCSVVCDDEEVASWARGVGAEVIWRPGRGLNGAVNDGVEELASVGYAQVIVAHADLPHAVDFAAVAGFSGVTLVPDRHEDGTNVACVPVRSGFVFSYGPRSFSRHCDEASRVGLPLRVVHEPRLAWDVDVPDDLASPEWLAT